MKYLSLTANSVDRLRNDFIKEHAKFIHSSYLLEDDLDKEIVIKDKKFRIAGLWDVIGYRKIILLQAPNGTHCCLDSKEVAEALGFTTFRNFVTGKPITYDIASQKVYTEMINKSKVDLEVIPDVVEEEDKIVEDEEVIEVIDEIDAPVMERDNEYLPENEESDEDVETFGKSSDEDDLDDDDDY